jgi:hypothetical protein
MASPLAATLRSKNEKTKNRALPGDTVAFEFSRLPRTADNLEIDVQQAQFREASGEVTPGALLATFKGQVRNGKYVPGSATAFRRRNVEDMVIKLTDGSNTIEIGLLDPPAVVTRNELQITVRGTVAGKTELFQGKAALFVFYPQVMIVPARGGQFDPALDMIARWAQQWKAEGGPIRHIQSVKPLKPPDQPRTGHYDSLIAAFAEAARSAPGGIVALAIGHGDGGVGAGLSVAWCDLLPEDVKAIEHADGSTSYPHTLFVNKTNLLFGHTPGNLPGSNDRRVLNAIDRIGDALKGARIPIRKLILHTCNVGNDKTVPATQRNAEIPGFTQLFANRAQVRVQAHTDFIVYESNERRPVLASYELEPPTTDAGRKTAKTEWPVGRVSEESVPGAPPRRFPP